MLVLPSFFEQCTLNLLRKSSTVPLILAICLVKLLILLTNNPKTQF